MRTATEDYTSNRVRSLPRLLVSKLEHVGSMSASLTSFIWYFLHPCSLRYPVSFVAFLLTSVKCHSASKAIVTFEPVLLRNILCLRVQRTEAACATGGDGSSLPGQNH